MLKRTHTPALPPPPQARAGGPAITVAMATSSLKREIPTLAHAATVSPLAAAALANALSDLEGLVLTYRTATRHTVDADDPEHPL